MKKARLGLIGIGGMGFFHFNSIQGFPEAVIVSVCDLEQWKINRCTEHKNSDGEEIRGYLDYKEMIEKEELDAVIVATPNYLHSEIAVYAMDHGLHAFTEKPDAINVEECTKMKEASERNNKVLMVMRNNRYYNNSEYLKKFIETGAAGDLYCGRCGWIRRRGIPGKGGWFTTKAQSGGGPLIDLGVHMIDLSMWLMGNPKPVSVSGCTFNKFAENTAEADSEHAQFGEAKDGGTFDVEDLAMGFIRFENGACLQIEFSWASNIEQETRFVELRGDKAGIRWSDDGSAHIYSENKDGLLTNETFKTDFCNGHGKAIRHFIDVILNDSPRDFVPQQGLNMIKILQAIYESAQTGKEVLL